MSVEKKEILIGSFGQLIEYYDTLLTKYPADEVFLEEKNYEYSGKMTIENQLRNINNENRGVGLVFFLKMKDCQMRSVTNYVHIKEPI